MNISLVKVNSFLTDTIVRATTKPTRGKTVFITVWLRKYETGYSCLFLQLKYKDRLLATRKCNLNTKTNVTNLPH